MLLAGMAFGNNGPRLKAGSRLGQGLSGRQAE